MVLAKVVVVVLVQEGVRAAEVWLAAPVRVSVVTTGPLEPVMVLVRVVTRLVVVVVVLETLLPLAVWGETLVATVVGFDAATVM